MASLDPTSLTCLDAKSFASDHQGSTVYTSPNMSYVPEPHNATEELCVRADGRFGTADCFQWPQLYNHAYRYAVCIRRSEHHPAPDPLSWAWYQPSIDDFEPLPCAAFRVGKLKEEKAVGMASLHQIAIARHKDWRLNRGDKEDIGSKMLASLQHDVMLLLGHPLTFRDIVVFVGQAQRYFLDLIAFLDYVVHVQPRIDYPLTAPTPVHSEWMGCFTTDTRVCAELFQAGVPVWLIRNSCTITDLTRIEKRVKYTFPDHIIRATYSENGGSSARPFPCLFRGAGGYQRHFHTRRNYVTTTDSPPTAFQELSAQVPSNVGKDKTNAKIGRVQHSKPSVRPQSVPKPKPKGSRDKWEELRVPEMPLSHSVWEHAMHRVDKDPSRVKRNLVDLGYRVPEPALFLSCEAPERRQLFMTNWLAIRPLWYSRLDHDPPARFPSPQLWRDILHYIPSKEELQKDASSDLGNKTAKGRKSIALDILGEDAAAMTQSSFAPLSVVEWRHRHIKTASLLNPPPRLIRAILWEIYEIGWRYELCALDQAINPRLWTDHREERVSLMQAICEGSAGLVLWSEKLPQRAGDFGLTDAWPSNSVILARLCCLLSGWPNAHPSFRDLPLLNPITQRADAYFVMSQACLFYVQTFFDYFGRPPLVPHQFPLEYHDD